MCGLPIRFGACEHFPKSIWEISSSACSGTLRGVSLCVNLGLCPTLLPQVTYEVEAVTADVRGAGTNGWVYLTVKGE